MLRWIALVAMVVSSLVDRASVRAERIGPQLRAGVFCHSPVGELGSELDVTWGARVAPGFGWGPIDLSVPLESGVTLSPHPERDTDSLATFGLGVAVEGTVVQSRRIGLHAGAGYSRRWLHGSGQVVRRCDQIGSCDGGYWIESPGYSMAGPFASLTTSFTAHRERVRIGVGWETRVEFPTIELPGAGTVRGLALSTQLAVWFAPAEPR